MASPVIAYSKVFKKLRVLLIRELPDPVVLLGDPQLKSSLSGYETSQILSPPTLLDRAEKFVDLMELCSNVAVFECLMSVLKQLKPGLAGEVETALQGTPNAGGSNCGGTASRDSDGAGLSVNANNAERNMQPQAVQGRQPQAGNPRQRGEEDAGVMGLNGYGGQGEVSLINHLSYNCREYLASELNADPPKREVFHCFCRALGVENRLVQASARSGNPTGYLLQKYGSVEPGATLESLRRALADIGLPHVFQELSAKIRNDGGGGGGGGAEDD